jgi:hypothetical protein
MFQIAKNHMLFLANDVDLTINYLWKCLTGIAKAACAGAGSALRRPKWAPLGAADNRLRSFHFAAETPMSTNMTKMALPILVRPCPEGNASPDSTLAFVHGGRHADE